MIIDIKKPNMINLTRKIAVKYSIGYAGGFSIPRNTCGEINKASTYDLTKLGSPKPIA
jgi:hypothetical protein